MQNLPETRMPNEKSDDTPAAAFKKPASSPARPVPPPQRESTIASIFWAVIFAMLIRTFLFEPFNIPSSSMVPNLLIGDFLFVSKFSYGYSAKSIGYGLIDFPGRIAAKLPERGDVIVFKLPTDPSIDYIKRLIGLPGDRIQMIHGRLYINGQMLDRQPLGEMHYSDQNHPDQIFQRYIETLPNGVKHIIVEESDEGPLDNTGEYIVPPGHYFMMGDNRDNSQDSRVMSAVGFVPYENLVGKADIIFFSLSDDTQAWEIWKWPFAIRYGRLMQTIR